MSKRPKPKTGTKPPPGDGRKRKTHLPGNRQHAAAERRRRLLLLLSRGNRRLRWGLRAAICPCGLKQADGAGMASAQGTSGWKRSRLPPTWTGRWTPAPTTSSRGSMPPPRLPSTKPPPPTTHSWRSLLRPLCIQGRDSHHDRRPEPKPSTEHTTVPDIDSQEPTRRNGINPKTGTAGERQWPSPQAKSGRSGKSASSR